MCLWCFNTSALLLELKYTEKCTRLHDQTQGQSVKSAAGAGARSRVEERDARRRPLPLCSEET